MSLVKLSEPVSEMGLIPPHRSQVVKNLPAMQETLVLFQGWEDPLKKGKATHSSILTSKIHNPWTCKESDSHSDFHFHFFHIVSVRIK